MSVHSRCPHGRANALGTRYASTRLLHSALAISSYPGRTPLPLDWALAQERLFIRQLTYASADRKIGSRASSGTPRLRPAPPSVAAGSHQNSSASFTEALLRLN
ncbi:hypothetical protein K523DRAFT_248944 [Schizophyllum commune Tattone D]|nr:hypothetical protein K523DRAFT_248944 [Schizophyllum commune Tattone D]